MARRFDYFFRETFIGIKRNGLVTFAAISTVFVSLFLLAMSLLVHRQVDLLVDEWAEKVEVSVFLREDASKAEIGRVGDKIRGLSEVETLYFESQEEAFKNFQDIFRDSPAMLRNVDASAMPVSYRVKLVDPKNIDVIAAKLAGEPGVDEVKDEREVVTKVLAVTDILRIGVGAVAIIMLVAAAALIGNTIRMAVFARRKEIGIMKLVGATNWFIRLPFLIEGVFEGLLGAGAAVLSVFVMKVLFIDAAREKVQFLPLIRTTDVVSTVPWLLGVGVLIAAVASVVAMRRFLDV